MLSKYACFVGSSVIYINTLVLVEQYSDRCTCSCSNIFIYSLHHVCQHLVLKFFAIHGDWLHRLWGGLPTVWYDAAWPFSALVDEYRCSTVKWYSYWLSLAFHGIAIDCHLLFMVMPLTVTCFSWYCYWLPLAFNGTTIDCHLLFMVLPLTVTCFSWYCDWLSLFMVLLLTVTCFSWYCYWLSLAFHGTAIDCHFSCYCYWLSLAFHGTAIVTCFSWYCDWLTCSSLYCY